MKQTNKALKAKIEELEARLSVKEEEKGYNGWTNYETWNCKLWMDNSQGDQEYWSEQAQDAYKYARADQYFTQEEKAVLNLSMTLEEYFDENMEEQGIQVSGFYQDILNSSLREINWHEIAKSLIKDVEKDGQEG